MNKVLTIHRFFIKLKNFSVTKKQNAPMAAMTARKVHFSCFIREFLQVQK